MIALAVSLAVFAVFYPLAVRGIDLHHDGLMLKTALDVASGQRLFGDTFTQYGPLTTYLQALALSLLGPTVWSLRVFTAACYAATAGLLYSAWRFFLPLGATLLALLLWLALAPDFSRVWTLHPWSSAPAMALQAGALLAWLSAVRAVGARRVSAFAAVSGLCAGLCFWARTPVGLLLTLALLAVELALATQAGRLAELRRRALPLALGASVVHAAFVAHLLRQGTLSLWWGQCVVGPAAWAGGQGTGIGRVLDSLFLIHSDFFAGAVPSFRRFAALAGFVAVPGLASARGRWVLAAQLACLAASMGLDWELYRTSEAWAFWIPWLWLAFSARRETWSSPLVLGLVAVSLASWMQYYPINCQRHVFWSLSPGVALVLIGWSGGARGRRGAVAILLLLAPLAASRAVQFVQKVRGLSARSDAPRLAGLRLTPEEAERFRAAEARVRVASQGRADAPWIIEGPDAFFATWARDLANDRPVFVSWGHLPLTAEEAARRRDFILARRPFVLVQEGARVGAVPAGYRSAGSLGPGWGELWTASAQR